MKKLLALTLAVVMCFVFFTGCGSSTSGQNPTPTSSAPSTGTPAPTKTEGPFAVPVDKWSNMTDEELYKIALTEPKTPITIYSISSKTATTCETFNKAYPGLTAGAQDMDQGPVLEKIKLEAKTGNPNADIAWLKDQSGEIYCDPTIMNLLEIYYPADISKHIDTRYLKYGLPVYAGLNMWYYSKKMYPDGPPIKNWWDVLEKDSSGKQKYALVLDNPSGNSTYMALYDEMIINPDLMAQAYKAKFGKDIEYTYDANQAFGLLNEKAPANNAGYEFLYRLSQMKLTFSTDGDTIVNSVQDSTVPTLGFCSAGKIKNSTDEKPIEWVSKLEPFLSVPGINNLYLLKNCKHPAGARLYIRYQMGGADGKGEGYKPLTGVGNWALRDDIDKGKNPFKIEETNALPTDIEGVNKIYDLSVEFWDYWLSKSPNK
jgi:iron(III) transport system substrate-binding protein